MRITETDYLEQIVHFITELLDKVHVGELVQHQLLRDGREGNLHTGTMGSLYDVNFGSVAETKPPFFG